jgi:nicotinate-nucleotide adenylyltransferase
MSQRVAILGGTFDPIHLGHLAIAADVQHAIGAARVLFVPAAQQPFKLGVPMTQAEDRLQMVRLAVADNPAFEVSTVEIDRGGVSYTVETVAQLRESLPHTELFLIVGADAAADLPRWHQAERLMSLCRVAVVERPGYRVDVSRMYTELPAARDRLMVAPGPAFTISASEIRQRVREGRPVRYHVPAVVYAYLRQRRLYESSSDVST